MKRGPAILIGGAVLLVAGIAIAAVWGVSFASSFIANNTIVGRTTIEPGHSISAKTDVTQLDKQLALTVGIDRNGQNYPSGAMLNETVTNPNGKILSSNEFANAYLTSIKPDIAGTYTVTITNVGTSPVNVGGTFGYMPMIGSNGKPDINAMMSGQGLGMVIAGGIMAAAGVVTLIVGGIITVVDSRTHRSASSASTEGGITYRKD